MTSCFLPPTVMTTGEEFVAPLAVPFPLWACRWPESKAITAPASPVADVDDAGPSTIMGDMVQSELVEAPRIVAGWTAFAKERALGGIEAGENAAHTQGADLPVGNDGRAARAGVPQPGPGRRLGRPDTSPPRASCRWRPQGRARLHRCPAGRRHRGSLPREQARHHSGHLDLPLLGEFGHVAGALTSHLSIPIGPRHCGQSWASRQSPPRRIKAAIARIDGLQEKSTRRINRRRAFMMPIALEPVRKPDLARHDPKPIAGFSDRFSMVNHVLWANAVSRAGATCSVSKRPQRHRRAIFHKNPVAGNDWGGPRPCVVNLSSASWVYCVWPGVKATSSPLTVSDRITEPASSIEALSPRFAASVQSVAPLWASAQ